MSEERAVYQGGPAFPRPASEFTKDGTLSDGNDAIQAQAGMTLRDWFAGMAMHDFMSTKGFLLTEGEIAKRSYELADAMLEQGAKAKMQTSEGG